MFESKQKKFKKYFKIKRDCKKYDNISSGFIYALAASENCHLKVEHLNCIVRTLKRIIKKKNTINLRVFPDFFVTIKPKDVRMGRGKGNPSHKIYPLYAGKVIVELKNVPENICRLAFNSCAIRLPINTIVLKKYDKRTDSIKSC